LDLSRIIVDLWNGSYNQIAAAALAPIAIFFFDLNSLGQHRHRLPERRKSAKTRAGWAEESLLNGVA
jgi:hypothetical protein